ncbi:M24 family metallopeptidase, partial [bacterium]|nr:M24 family metallopeptidase [bacterium]
MQLKTAQDISGIYSSGQVAGRFLSEVAGLIKPGVSTKELDDFAADFISKQGGKPAFKGYRGFPANVCTSINNQVVHGIPGERTLKDGDLLSLDVGVEL